MQMRRDPCCRPGGRPHVTTSSNCRPPPHYAGLDRFTRFGIPPSTHFPMAEVRKGVGANLVFTKQFTRLAGRYSTVGNLPRDVAPVARLAVPHSHAKDGRTHAILSRSSTRRCRPWYQPEG